MNLLNQNDCSTASEAPVRLTVVPRYQVRETDGAYVITALVPGAHRSTVETTVDEESLTISARRNFSISGSFTSLHRESTDADYRLMFDLDNRVNRDGVTAELTQGVLTLTILKADVAKPWRIDIQG